MLLGAPLHPSGFTNALGNRLKSLIIETGRLNFLSAHEAFFLHRNCLSIPKWLHLLRSSPSWESSPGLLRIDQSQRDTLTKIINVDLSDTSWSQANLHVRWGGVGVRSLDDLAPSAFLASAFLTQPLIESLLQPIALASFEATVSEAVTHWTSQNDFPSPTGTLSIV